MQNKWTDPVLGTFHCDDTRWRRKINLTSVGFFSYVDAAVGVRTSPLQFEVVLVCDTESDFPNTDMALAASHALDNEGELIPKVLAAIWDDLNGRGPNSGMWWHGDLPNAHRDGWASGAYDELCEHGLPVPESAEDLKLILEPIDLTVRRDPSDGSKCISELNFYCGFDVEHGIGVLKDGVDILGIGYAYTARRFRW